MSEVPAVHEEVIKLGDFIFGVVEHLKRQQGEILPVAALIDSEGEIQPFAVLIDEKENQAEAIIEEHFRVLETMAEKGEVRAYVIAYEARFSKTGNRADMEDAIALRTEHVGGNSLMIFFPCKKKFLRGFQYGEPILQKTEPRIFASTPKP